MGAAGGRFLDCLHRCYDIIPTVAVAAITATVVLRWCRAGTPAADLSFDSHPILRPLASL